MTGIVTKLRDILGDNYKVISETQDYISSLIFTLQNANIDSTSLVVQNNGVVWSATIPAGSTVAWTRSGSTITITKTSHGLITGDSVALSASSDVTALPLATYLVTKLTTNTFTVVGLNAGASSGTCSYPTSTNYSYSSTTGAITITGTVIAGDVFTFIYNAYEKYSDAELQGYVRSALYYLTSEKYKIFIIRPPTYIFPTPTEEEECLVAVVAAILIKGSISYYQTPEFRINFAENIPVSKRIKTAVAEFKKSFGVLDYIDLTDEPAEVEEDED